MTQDQGVILIILVATLLAFLWGRWRHDVVALASLLICVFTGMVPAGEAFEIGRSIIHRRSALFRK
jgi:di/tricarboxylate transporter